MILAESPEPQPSSVPALGEYEDRRRQLQHERKTEYNQHLAAVCDVTVLLMHLIVNSATFLNAIVC